MLTRPMFFQVKEKHELLEVHGHCEAEQKALVFLACVEAGCEDAGAIKKTAFPSETVTDCVQAFVRDDLYDIPNKNFQKARGIWDDICVWQEKGKGLYLGLPWYYRRELFQDIVDILELKPALAQ